MEIERAVSPLRGRHGLKAVPLDRRHQVGRHRLATAGHPESAVGAEPAGATGDLTHLLRVERPLPLAVELGEAGEGDVVDVHVQAHADGVGGHQEIDLAGLVKRHLGVARARRQGAHHHRRPAPLATDQFGDGIDLVGREGDHGAAPRQPGELARPGVGQAGESLAGDDLRPRQQPANQRRHCPGAEEHGLERPAGVQKAMGEQVAAFGVGCELDLIDGEKLDIPAQRHGLDGADEIMRPGRDDLLLAGDQGDGARASGLDHPVVDLAGQQAQRQADHAGGVAEHPLHGQMRLAGVGRAQNRDQPGRRLSWGPMTHGSDVPQQPPERNLWRRETTG